jgi:hypothetical protein
MLDPIQVASRQEAREIGQTASTDQERLLNRAQALLGILLFYDISEGVYRQQNGNAVPRRRVRSILDRTIVRYQREMRTQGQRLRDGEITLAEWQGIMLVLIRQSHLATIALQRGGFAQLDIDNFTDGSDLVAEELNFLRRFALQIATGVALLDGNILRRSGLYAQKIRATFHASEQEEMEDAGATLEHNVLSPVDHCSGGASCEGETNRGWVPLGSLVPIGYRTCQANCQCYIEYMDDEGNVWR